ncbi:MAG: TIGR04282 family arsenosugar biosynthesis glycosyltransferase [Acidobacteria bacterium]|nr:TIGR04282 family arsenosugar biosynthesis glycosyltransferase [Acidobacteriota bacterium]
MPQPIVIVMVKAPRPGEVKTRLVPPLSESAAAVLAACFARDTILNAQRAADDVLVAYAPADARSDLKAILPSDLHWFAQAGDNLGQRLDSVAEYAFSLGFSPLVILGADSPTLPTSFIRETVNVLTAGEADVCLGPTEDGGYYLVGLHGPVPGLFQNIDWSTPSA